VCDPPYGLRKPRMSDTPLRRDADSFDSGQSQRRQLVAALAASVQPLLELAVRALEPGGRLVFLFPSFRVDRPTDEARLCRPEAFLPARAGLRLLCCCSQPFDNFDRNGVVMVRVEEGSE
jgi:hypothetical protein